MPGNAQYLSQKLEGYGGRADEKYALRLSLRPLLALRIALRECDTFFLGTASKNGGNNSSNESRGDAVHLNDAHVGAWGKKCARFGNRARVESAMVVAIRVLVAGVRTELLIPVSIRLNVKLHCFLQYRGLDLNVQLRRC